MKQEKVNGATKLKSDELITITGYAAKKDCAYRTVKRILKAHPVQLHDGKYKLSDLEDAYNEYYKSRHEREKEKLKEQKEKEKLLNSGMLKISQIIEKTGIKRETLVRLVRVKKELKGKKINNVYFYTKEQIQLLEEYLKSGKQYDEFYVDHVDGIKIEELTNSQYRTLTKKKKIHYSGRYGYVLKKDLEDLKSSEN